eukprot:2672914-Pyramimonas_sp.AAC.1
MCLFGGDSSMSHPGGLALSPPARPPPEGGKSRPGASPCLRESGRPDRDTSQQGGANQGVAGAWTRAHVNVAVVVV